MASSLDDTTEGIPSKSCFVEYVARDSAWVVVSSLDRTVLDGRTVLIKMYI